MKSSAARKVLIVEDKPPISRVCERVLTAEGYEADIALNGKIAQGMIEEKDYGLCLIDMRTPAMSGKELYYWLKEKHPQMAESVIFTTGDVMGEETKSFLEQTTRPFLPKPFTPEELRVIIKETLRG